MQRNRAARGVDESGFAAVNSYGAGSWPMPSLSALDWLVIAVYFGVLFLISVAVIVVLSYSAASPKPGQVRGLTLATINREDVRQSYDRKDIAATAVVLGLVVTIYIYFSFWVWQSQVNFQVTEMSRIIPIHAL